MNRERRTEDISVTSGLFRASLSLFLSSLSAWGHRCLSTTREPATIRLCILAVGRAKEIRPGPEKKKKSYTKNPSSWQAQRFQSAAPTHQAVSKLTFCRR